MDQPMYCPGQLTSRCVEFTDVLSTCCILVLFSIYLIRLICLRTNMGYFAVALLDTAHFLGIYYNCSLMYLIMSAFL